MRPVRVRHLAPPVVALAALLYLPRLTAAGAALSERVASPRSLDAIGSFIKLGSLLAGAWFGARCAARLERDNPARRSWLALGVWLFLFGIGQAVLMFYPMALDAEPPLPSAGDVAFLLGYAVLIGAVVRFIQVYRASGFPVGTAREHLGIAGGAAVAFALAGVPILAPIARAPVPLAERSINVAYPVLDFVALAATLVLLRIALAFRGGKVWTTWAAILAGFALMAAGDIAFAYLSSIKVTSLGPLVDLTLLLGYFAAACGTMLEHEMLAE
jgi:hypothetical protein